MPAPLRIRLDRAITLRATAIAAVVLYHALTVPFGALPRNAGADAPLATGLAQSFAWVLGVLPGIEQVVAIFFIIAGYFAHRAYQRSRLSQSRRARRTFVKFFLWRRFWRLVPAFWAALLFSYFVSFDHPFSWDGLRKLVVNASLLKTLYPGYYFSINSAHWYVAVQWQLDLLYPLFLYLVARRSTRFAVVLAWTAAIVVTFVLPQLTSPAYFVNLPFRWWAEWSAGVYLADRHLGGVRVFPRPGWTLLGATAIAVGGHWAGLELVSWFAVRVLLACGFEAMLLSRSPRRQWERQAAAIGVCSYSLYLLHIPVQQLVARGLLALGADLHSVLVWLVFAVTSSVLAFGLAKLAAESIEQECAALGNRLWRRRFVIRAWVRMRRRRFGASLAALIRPKVRPA